MNLNTIALILITASGVGYALHWAFMPPLPPPRDRRWWTLNVLKGCMVALSVVIPVIYAVGLRP